MERDLASVEWPIEVTEICQVNSVCKGLENPGSLYFVTGFRKYGIV